MRPVIVFYYTFICLWIGMMPPVRGESSDEAGTEIEATELVLSRYEELLQKMAPLDTAELEQWVQTLSSEGRWPDIAYASQQKTSWPPRDHLRRTVALFRHAQRDDFTPELREAMERAAWRALDHFLASGYRSLNWYHNEISVPQAMRDIAILLGDRLEGERRDAVLTLLDQSRLDGTGANLVWSGELRFHLGCLRGDRAALNQLSHRIWSEITLDGVEGIQSDGSFFQHQERLQNFVYGKGFGRVIVALAWQLRGTPWALPEEKAEIINRFLLDGSRWLSLGKRNSPLGVDRAIAQPHAFTAADFEDMLVAWRDVAPGRLDEIDSYLAEQRGAAVGPRGLRFFPQGDAAVYRLDEGSFFLNMRSDRTEGTESFIGVNFPGLHTLAMGNHYVMREGNEYEGLQPVWDWSRLPGLTLPAYRSTLVEKPFTGGLSDGERGLATMDYTQAGEAGFFTVKKSWFFHDGLILGLLGGWDYTTFWGQITTGLEQSRWQSEMVFSVDETVQTVAAPGDAADPGMGAVEVDWVVHDQIGYMVLEGAKGILRLGPQAGSWRLLDRDRSPAPVLASVFGYSMEHTHEPSPTGFVIVPGASADAMIALADAPPWTILRNDEQVQAVTFSDGTRYAVFYTAASAGGITVNRSCAVMVSPTGEWRISDPRHRGGALEIEIDGTSYDFTLPNNGAAIHGASETP